MARKFMRSLPQLLRNRSGVAMVELALVTPMLAVMTAGTIDYAMLIVSKLAVEGAARDGASYAVAHGYDSATIGGKVTASSGQRSTSFLSAITANPAPSRWYGCADAATGVVTATSSTSICPSGLTAGTYVTVSASGTYTYLIPWPTLGTSYVINASVKTRIS